MNRPAIMRQFLPRQLIAALLLGSLSQLALAVPVLWGVDEDDGQLFSIDNYNDAANTFTDYGNLKWNNGGNIEEIGKHIEAFTIRDDGVAFFVANKNIGGFDEPVLFSFDLNTVSTTGNNVASIIGQIDIGFDNAADNITGLSFNPNSGALTVLFQDEGTTSSGGGDSDHSSDSDHNDDSDHSSDSDHNDDSDHSSDSDHNDDSDHSSDSDHNGDSDHSSDSDHNDDSDHNSDSDHNDDSDHSSDSDHNDDSDHSSDSDHNDDSDHSSDSDHNDDSDHDSDSDHNGDSDHDSDSDHGDDDDHGGDDNGTAGVDRLLTIDVTNADVLSDELIQGLGEASITGEDFTFDADGNIILSDTDDNQLYIVDPATGAITGIYDADAEGGLGPNPRIEALAYDTENDTLVGFDDSSNLFLNLPQGDGGNDGDFGGIAGLTDVEGLAFWTPDSGNPVPAPASMLLLGLGLLNIGWMRRRQRRAAREG